MALSDRIVVMRGGRILQTGAPAEIYQGPNSEAVASFLGSPQPLGYDRQRNRGGVAGYLQVQGAGQ